MNPTLRLGLLTVAAVVLVSAVSAWTARLPAFPLLLPLLLGAALTVPAPTLTRLSAVGAVAAELGSGLPPGIAFVATLIPPHVLLALVRWQRPAQPWPVRWLLSTVFLFIVLSVLQVAAFTGEPRPAGWSALVIGREVVSPAISGGLLAAVVASLLPELGPRLTRLIGLPES